MKQLYFLVIAISLSVLSFAQTEGAAKIYGYRQKSMPGTVRVDDNGNQVPRKPQYNYFIYLASTSKVTPVEICIDGESYSVIVSEVSSPVKYTHPTSGDNKPKTLVPKTTRRIFQLVPSANKIEKPTSKGKTLSAKNELVIIYRGGNKLYYKTISKLSELEPVSMQ